MKRTLEQLLEDEGYEDVVIFGGGTYDQAFIGISTDNRAVYSYDKMVEANVEHDGMDYYEAMEFVDYNPVRSLPYLGNEAPIVVYEIPWEE